MANTILRHIIDPWCMGNSHAWIVCQYNSTSARCACSGTLNLMADGKWVHGDYRIACSAYECKCGQRHNTPQTEEDQAAWNLAVARQSGDFGYEPSGVEQAAEQILSDAERD